MAKIWVGVTDRGWFEHLRTLADLDEVNFWQPSASGFGVLKPGEMFLFKLHAPANAIVGGGFFARYAALPLILAWDYFKEKNGVATEGEMQSRVATYVRAIRSTTGLERGKHVIGCILLEQPFFFKESEWIAQPAEWARNIVQGRSWDLHEPVGQRLFSAVSDRLGGLTARLADEASGRYGAPTLVQHRLGQGSFRAAVADAYRRECAASGDRVIYVLDAAHIRPYAQGGEHSVANGLLLRSDIHTLFDRGYISVDDELRLLVSRRLREEFHNGKEYYALEGRPLALPASREDHPDPDLLRWHRSQVFEAA